MTTREKTDFLLPKMAEILGANSHLTAIARKALPVPVRWLLSQGMVHGHLLDYGCGKCAEINKRILRNWGSGTFYPEIKSVTSYDPYYAPNAIKESGRVMWDVVLCTYVLCTLPWEEERQILNTIKNKLLPNGVAYITVRADEPRQGYGKSSKGTFQRKVEMPYLYELRKTTNYRIYLLTSSTTLV